MNHGLNMPEEVYIYENIYCIFKLIVGSTQAPFPTYQEIKEHCNAEHADSIMRKVIKIHQYGAFESISTCKEEDIYIYKSFKEFKEAAISKLGNEGFQLSNNCSDLALLIYFTYPPYLKKFNLNPISYDKVKYDNFECEAAWIKRHLQ